MNGKINWNKSDTNTFTKIERKYLATIVVNASGQATLTITAQAGAAPAVIPAPKTWVTIKLAKQAFRIFLRDISVTA